MGYERIKKWQGRTSWKVHTRSIVVARQFDLWGFLRRLHFEKRQDCFPQEPLYRQFGIPKFHALPFQLHHPKGHRFPNWKTTKTLPTTQIKRQAGKTASFSIEYYDFDEQTRPIKRFIETKGTPSGKKDILLIKNLFRISPIISSATLICSRLIKHSYGILYVRSKIRCAEHLRAKV